ncbi:hypothetical protein UY3_00223 [Chelonia mydas]|uniref:Uncharacterized protein n=1 Tax=Chelonia mydas TaxID=8469 RepID=M7CCR1_CHEMY|nr:hypothetical protein UY3_00223 [Chelonia mydas]
MEKSYIKSIPLPKQVVCIAIVKPEDDNHGPPWPDPYLSVRLAAGNYHVIADRSQALLCPGLSF